MSNYAQWVQPNGKPHTRETMQKVALEEFSRLREKQRDNMSFPPDGSKGQYSAYSATMLAALRNE